MQDLLNKVAELAELQKQATPGKWLNGPDLRPSILVKRVGSSDPGGMWLHEYRDFQDRPVQVGVVANLPKHERAQYDAEFIAAAGSFDFAALAAALATPTPATPIVVAESAGGEQIDRMSLGKHRFGQAICELMNHAEILREDGCIEEFSHHEAAALCLYRATPAASFLGSGDAAKSALVNDAERKYLEEVFACLPDSMSDFLADFLKRLTPLLAAASTDREVPAAASASLGGGAATKLVAESLPNIVRWLDLAIAEADKDEPNDGYETLLNAAEKASALLKKAHEALAADQLLVESSGAGWIRAAEGLLPTEFDQDGLTQKWLVCIDGQPSWEGHYYTKSGKWMVAGRYGYSSNVTHYMGYPAAPADDAR